MNITGSHHPMLLVNSGILEQLCQAENWSLSSNKKNPPGGRKSPLRIGLQDPFQIAELHGLWMGVFLTTAHQVLGAHPPSSWPNPNSHFDWVNHKNILPTTTLQRCGSPTILSGGFDSSFDVDPQTLEANNKAPRKSPFFVQQVSVLKVVYLDWIPTGKDPLRTIFSRKHSNRWI